MARHIVLLGDSVFDNAAYTRGEPDVADHLRALLPDVAVTLCAVDGSTTAEIPAQLAGVPASATDLVLSVGGNDALLQADLIDTRVRSTAEALALFGERLTTFEGAYARALGACLTLGKPVVACTIYNGGFEGAEAAAVWVAIMMFDDVILQTALRLGADAIDLRLVCARPEDFANPIEPSGEGGRRIARAIAAAVGAAGQPGRRMVVTAD